MTTLKYTHWFQYAFVTYDRYVEEDSEWKMMEGTLHKNIRFKEKEPLLQLNALVLVPFSQKETTGTKELITLRWLYHKKRTGVIDDDYVKKHKTLVEQNSEEEEKSKPIISEKKIKFTSNNEIGFIASNQDKEAVDVFEKLWSVFSEKGQKKYFFPIIPECIEALGHHIQNNEICPTLLKKLKDHAKENERLLKKFQGSLFEKNIYVPHGQQLMNFVRAAKYARTDYTVFIRGESGTGKESLARFIHDKANLSTVGDKKKDNYFPLNCGGITPTLIESELFGHVQGAFTGATKDKIGLLEQANDGTLFLDEVGELSENAQVKLLRFLETNEVVPVGSTEAKTVNVRLICATHKDIESMVRNKKIRLDLYFRLFDCLTVELMPLREYSPYAQTKVAEAILREVYSKDMKSTTTPRMTKEFIDKLLAHSWPGNNRELRNYLRRVAVLSNFPDTISRLDIPFSKLGTNPVDKKNADEEYLLDDIVSILRAYATQNKKTWDNLIEDIKSRGYRKIVQEHTYNSRTNKKVVSEIIGRNYTNNKFAGLLKKYKTQGLK